MTNTIDINNEVNFRKRLGEDTIKILEDNGIDISKVFKETMEKKIAENILLDEAILINHLDAIMTSELVYLSMKYKHQSDTDIYIKEWMNRMEMISMTKDQMEIVLKREKEALNYKIVGRDTLWVKRTPLGEGITKKDLPIIEQLTLSEINLFTDYAMYLKAYEHEYLSDEAWGAVVELAYNQTYTRDLKIWIEKNDIPYEQVSAFWYNEGSLLAEFKYGYGKNQSRWRKTKI